MTTLTPDLAERAHQAWGYMTQAVNPMPAEIAVDFVMNDLTDDREACKRALYGAAADTLLCPLLNQGLWNVTGPSFVDSLRRGYMLTCGADIDRIRVYDREEPYDSPDYPQAERRLAESSQWREWCDRADAALALCRAIKDAP
jgi:hypothetical protein